jgi:hypothetical protein
MLDVMWETFVSRFLPSTGGWGNYFIPYGHLVAGVLGVGCQVFRCG